MQTGLDCRRIIPMCQFELYFCFFSTLLGDLFSVDPRLLRHINGIFNFNERVVLSGHWEHGPFLYAAVGAYNVGSIKLDLPMEKVRYFHCYASFYVLYAHS